MNAGDLIHPRESLDAAQQVAIVADYASRWHAAHLLLFVGLLLFVPGILAVTGLAAKRKPATGYAARLLMLASVGAMSAVFVFEMLLGRFVSDGADAATATLLLETFESAQVFGALVPGLLAFFVGTAMFVVPLALPAGPFRRPALTFAVGALLILAEIISGEVLFSQIGNVLILIAGASFAWVIIRTGTTAPAFRRVL